MAAKAKGVGLAGERPTFYHKKKTKMMTLKAMMGWTSGEKEFILKVCLLLEFER